MGSRGRLVVPAQVRERAGLAVGAPLILLETTSGLVVMTREQARDQVRTQLADAELVPQLLTERRKAAEREYTAEPW
ncbi:cell division protein MraZ [Cellulomonas sp. WB94]|uniref:AbrB/MazE/SpoVT family DNA-binding domain-containing protein n=1 Tax=Cellulomonas sp. WB94 TaxID=2173174 RepID=UPI000D56C9D9|nr:AbrB/MazE/SpoVT family DNA-binding domain-containing protein [Cellulomonas sp. WB94]PVU84059.1 cell division protein MraZ [Cellulomonas sp. WB94]